MKSKRFLIYIFVLCSVVLLFCGCSEENVSETETNEVIYSTVEICRDYMRSLNLTVDDIKKMFVEHGVDENCIEGDSHLGLTIKIPSTQKSEILEAVSSDAKKANEEFCEIKRGYKLIYYTFKYQADLYCDEEIPLQVLNTFVERVYNNMVIEDILSGNASETAVSRIIMEEGEDALDSHVTANVKSTADGSPLVITEQETAGETAD